MSIVNEFKEFISKGNVIDLAVGIIMGTAFGKVVSSLVEDVVMPPIGYLMGGVDFSELAIVLKEAVKNSAGVVTTEAVSIQYGTFINTLINFLVVSASVFVMVKVANFMKNQRQEETVSDSVEEIKEDVNEEVELLKEIRDALKK